MGKENVLKLKEYTNIAQQTNFSRVENEICKYVPYFYVSLFVYTAS